MSVCSFIYPCKHFLSTCVTYVGDYCYSYHCHDVNNCGGNGECVGPNQCKCRDGWIGRACSSSFCPQYTSCVTCSRQKGLHCYLSFTKCEYINI